MTKPTGSERKRRPLFTPLHRNLELTLGEYDLQLLHHLRAYRVLSTGQIVALMPQWPYESLRKRLTDLYHHFYIDRPQYQRYFQITREEPWDMIYAITNKGLGAISFRSPTRYDTKNLHLSPLYLRHRLQINTFKIALELALKAHPTHSLEWWLFDRTWHTTVSEITLAEQKVSKIWPDGSFAILNRTTNQRSYGFVEVDTGTEDHSRLGEKLTLYQRLALANTLTAPLPPVEQIKGFRVFVVLNSPARQATLIQKAQRLKEKLGMFYTTTKDEIHYAKAHHLLEPIWQTLRLTQDPATHLYVPIVKALLD